MDYLIGDLQGCCDPLERLLDKVGFSPSRDCIHVLGDLVNRGPQSLQVIEKLMGLGDSARCLLGNHDLHLLAIAHGVRRRGRGDSLDPILDHPQRAALLDWLRTRSMAAQACGWLLVHAGVVPEWTAEQTMALAGEVEAQLRGDALQDFLDHMYGDEPDRWRDDLAGFERWRFIVNVLTRLRFCTADGTLKLDVKDGPEAAPEGALPWFEHAGRKTQDTPIAFGHWSTLGLIDTPTLLSTDTGCVWGGRLTAVRVDGGRREVTQVECEQARRPGKT